MTVVVVIPARYASSRYPGKPLAPLRGSDGCERPLVEWTWRAAKAASGVDAIVIATDDDRIRLCAEGFGADVVMTSERCRNGTERCAEAVRNFDLKPKIVVNVQGDAPLTPPWFVEALVAELRSRNDVAVATPVLRCDPEAHARFVEDRRAGRVGGTTAVFDANCCALYFSKEVIPFVNMTEHTEVLPVYHHVGVYAYRPDALELYAGWPMGALEQAEGLEQLRFLENGQRILCVEVEAQGKRFWELNNPEDRQLVEAGL